MKATIDGITYEGTPEEISAMMLIQASQKHNKPFKQPEGMIADWLVRYPNYQLPYDATKTVAKTGCSNKVCYCDGSCNKPQSLTGTQKFINYLDSVYDANNT
jgi:hypothetical protein